MNSFPESNQTSNTEKKTDTQGCTNQDQTIIQKISKFMEMKNIHVAEFWQSDRKHASPEDIEKFCQSCGMSLSIRDKTILNAEIFSNNRQVISIFDMCNFVDFWKQNNQQRISSFLKEKSEIFVQEMNSKNKRSNRIAISAKGNRNHYRNSPMGTPNISTPQKISHQTTYIPNNSLKYLHRYRQKVNQSEQKLTETIQKTKNQYQYSLMVKMNQLNESNKKGKSNITYRPVKNAEGVIKVNVFNLDKLQRELTLKEFESEYKICRKGTKQNKNWEQISSNCLNKREICPNLNHQKNMKKEQRQQELKNLLTNTVSLTNLLKQQIKIFKMRGIYGCENLL